MMPATSGDPGDFLADVRALEAAGAEMIGVAGDPPEKSILLGAIAAVTHRVRLLVNGDEPAGLAGLSRGRVVVGPPPGESWAEVAMPADRDAWTAMVQEHEKAGATGVVVPWDPRLIDLLRNPEPDDRSDLQMSTG